MKLRSLFYGAGDQMTFDFLLAVFKPSDLGGIQDEKFTLIFFRCNFIPCSLDSSILLSIIIQFFLFFFARFCFFDTQNGQKNHHHHYRGSIQQQLIGGGAQCGNRMKCRKNKNPENHYR